MNDNIGKIFGKYLITGIAKKRDTNNHIKYTFRCLKCGYEDNNGTYISNIKKGGIKSECNHPFNPYDLINKQIGKYLILDVLNQRNNNGNIVYKVKCLKCGKIVNGIRLDSMKKTSLDDNITCNHIIFPEKMIGKIIGKYKILDIIKDNNNSTKYIAQCLKCGFITTNGITLNSMKYSSLDKNIKCNHIYWKSEILFNKFQGMKNRCYDINHDNYYRYGGRGIKICDEWLNKPWKFQEWAYENGYQDGLSIDRINNDEDYCPENCRWVTLSENSKFQSTSIIININGISDTLHGWSIRLGFTPSHFYTILEKFSDKNEGLMYIYNIITEIINKQEFIKNGKIFPVFIITNKKV